MEILIGVGLTVALGVGAYWAGSDSRLPEADRPNSWWPGRKRA